MMGDLLPPAPPPLAGIPCPRCSKSMDESVHLLADFDAITLRCKPCGLFQVKGDPDHRQFDKASCLAGNILGSLRERAAELGMAKRMASVVESIMETSLEDPRWTKVTFQ